MKMLARSKRRAPAQQYETLVETEAAVSRIRAQFADTKNSLAVEKEYNSSPEGILKTALQSLLGARKAMTSARREIGVAIATLRQVLPNK